MNKRDPKGFYAILGIVPDASAVEIKAAFRRRAKILHPDHNRAHDASAQFQMLNAAYEVLNDPSSRARYDTMTLETADTARAEEHQPAEPIVCSCCGKVSAQPRYVIFFTLKSFILITLRNTIQGIFCSACAEKQSYKASVITLLLGWWGLPWGPIFSTHAIIANMMGGKRPPEVNARIAMHQAWYFATLGKVDVARAVAMDAVDLAKKAPSTPEGAALRTDAEKLLQIIGGTTQRLKNSWRRLSRPFFVQAAAVAVIVIGAALVSALPLPGPKARTAAAPAKAATPTSGQSGYVRPATTPNGLPWPVMAGYLPGVPLFNADGSARVKVDNSRNGSDVFAKLVSLESADALTVRQFYVPARQSFTLGGLRQGTYEIRYKDLNSGAVVRSEQFSLTDKQTLLGIPDHSVMLTLPKARHGDTRMGPVANDEF